jgi:hypothetical protein
MGLRRRFHYDYYRTDINKVYFQIDQKNKYGVSYTKKKRKKKQLNLWMQQYG